LESKALMSAEDSAQACPGKTSMAKINIRKQAHRIKYSKLNGLFLKQLLLNGLFIDVIPPLDKHDDDKKTYFAKNCPVVSLPLMKIPVWF